MTFIKLAKLFNHHYKSILEYFHHSNKISYPFSVNFHLYPVLQEAIMYFLSPRIYLLWTLI